MTITERLCNWADTLGPRIQKEHTAGFEGYVPYKIPKILIIEEAAKGVLRAFAASTIVFVGATLPVLATPIALSSAIAFAVMIYSVYAVVWMIFANLGSGNAQCQIADYVQQCIDPGEQDIKLALLLNASAQGDEEAIAQIHNIEWDIEGNQWLDQLT